MSRAFYEKHLTGNAAEHYERYFVPSIGEPVARDLIEAADLRPAERVLDVACGTGIVTRLAAERVGETALIAGLDVNPAMLEVARSVAPKERSIDWYETGAEAMPLPDDSFDVALCGMGVQFFSDKLGALREIRRVLRPGGRLVFNLPGPIPAPFEVMAEQIARHLGSGVAPFVHVVFSLNDADELHELMRSAGFRSVEVHAAEKEPVLPAPGDFLWQYMYSTPLASALEKAGDEQRAALERDVCAAWEPFVVDGRMTLRVRVTTVRGEK